MKFHFDVSINDNDYLEFNKFHMLKSPYGKKITMGIRLFIAVLICAFAALFVIFEGFDFYTMIALFLFLIALVVLELLLPLYLSLNLKSTIKKMNKTGKPGYAPESVLEFYDDFLLEITDTNKTELKYSVIERISVIEGGSVYIHLNNVGAIILPLAAFESSGQFYEFFNFIKTKCSIIDFYPTNK